MLAWWRKPKISPPPQANPTHHPTQMWQLFPLVAPTVIVLARGRPTPREYPSKPTLVQFPASIPCRMLCMAAATLMPPAAMPSNCSAPPLRDCVEQAASHHPSPETIAGQGQASLPHRCRALISQVAPASNPSPITSISSLGADRVMR